MTQEEWSAERLGHVTGSNLYKIMGKTAKGLYLADRKKYMYQLASERLTGQPTEFYKSKSMARGTDEEYEALCFYEETTGHAMQAGDFTFFKHPTMEWFGASPDGYNPEIKKGAEFKNRDCDNHLEFLVNPVLPESALYQCYAGLMCLGYDTWDYASYDSRFIEEKHRMKIVTVTLDVATEAQITMEVRKFLSELDEMIYRLQNES